MTPDTSTKFKILAKTGRVFELEADNTTDRDAWMETVLVAISHTTVRAGALGVGRAVPALVVCPGPAFAIVMLMCAW